MMDDAILISQLNDFVFCPISIYFHKLYGNMDKMIYQDTYQLNGSAAHRSVDFGKYSTSKNILQGIDVYSDKYNLVGKIDLFDISKGVLRERKKHVRQIYDGYIFQLYAQYFALVEMGYNVKKIMLYSMDDNKSYNIELPHENNDMLIKFESIIYEMRHFEMDKFQQNNFSKCKNCIYEPSCDRFGD